MCRKRKEKSRKLDKNKNKVLFGVFEAPFLYIFETHIMTRDF